jgi:hypothetical protein
MCTRILRLAPPLQAFYSLSLPGWAGARPPTQAFLNAYRATARSPDRTIDQAQFVKVRKAPSVALHHGGCVLARVLL